MFFWIVPTVAGVLWVFQSGKITGPGLWVLVAGQVLGWIALNIFGLFENGRIRRDSMRNLALRRPPAPGPVIFVGCASTKHQSMLDAHEDVGFLSFGPQELEFIGDEKRMRILREQIQKVHFQANVHSIVGLGRWISIEATINGLPVRLLLEPRERNTMFGNLMLSGWLRKVIEDWKAGVLPEPAHHDALGQAPEGHPDAEQRPEDQIDPPSPLPPDRPIA
jgi:hypothetical protein